MVMRVPTRKDFLPILARLLAKVGTIKAGEAIESVANLAGLTAEQREVMSEAKAWEPKYRNIIRWTRQDLNFAGLLDRSMERGIWALNEKGKELVARQSNNDELIRAVYSLQPTRIQDEEAVPSSCSLISLENSAGENVQAPDEAVLATLREYDAYIKESLLQELLSVTSIRFEYIVCDLLVASLRAARWEVTQASRDLGIDGRLWQDHLRLTKTVYQAKKNESNVVGRTAIDAFYAAAIRENASAMVFVTTSTYSFEAKDAAKSFGIRLIDGAELVDLMLEVGVGVRARQKLSLYTIDEAYFNEGD
jgi:restriction system protein